MEEMARSHYAFRVKMLADYSGQLNQMKCDIFSIKRKESTAA